MVAIPFPCNGILLIQGNLPRLILVFILNDGSFLILYFKFFTFFSFLLWKTLKMHILTSILESRILGAQHPKAGQQTLNAVIWYIRRKKKKIKKY